MKNNLWFAALRLGLLAICILLTLAACSKEGGKSAESGDYNGVVVRMTVDRNILHVNFTMTVTNYGKKPVVVDLSKPVIDIIINYGDQSLAQWSVQQPPDVNTHHLELKPNESKVIELTWTPQPGDELRIYGTTGIVWLDDKVAINAPGNICVKACYQ